GGVGKTAMVCRLLKSLGGGLFPDGSPGVDVAGIIYMNEVGSRPISFPNLFSDLLFLLDEDVRGQVAHLQENSQSTVSSKLTALTPLLPTKPIVVLLDNFEDRIDRETGNIKDVEMREALIYLLRSNNHSIQFIITTRIPCVDFNFIEPGRQRHIN